MKTRLPALQAYWLMLVATVITIAIVTASQLITQRISLLLDRQASELLAADLVVVSNTPLSNNYRQQAIENGLSVASTTSLRTAIFIDDEPQLVELKAVSDNYPLRGQLEIARDLTTARQTVNNIPEKGEVWVDSKLSRLLNSQIDIGFQVFDSRWLLTHEPDRGGALFNLAPRVLMNLEDLEATGLIIPGSRVTYRLLFSGNEAQISRFSGWLAAQLVEGERIQDMENARPEMRRALERTRKFFALSIILTLVIAMVAIAITARYAAGREAARVAILRAFGIPQSRLLRFYLLQITRLWLIASILGMGLGGISQYPLEWALDDWFSGELPQVYIWYPYLLASLIGFISLMGFCLPYLLEVISTAPMQVFRPVVNRRSLRHRLFFSFSAVFTVFLVLVMLMRSSMLAIALLAMVLLVALILPFLFILLVRFLLVTGKRQFWLKGYLLSRFRSSNRGAVLVMSGFTLALMAILLIAVVKDELLTAWQTQLPDNIPNYFLINLQKEDVAEIQVFLKEQAIASSNPYPLVRTRLTAINQIPVKSIIFSHPGAHHLTTHTFNVSYTEKLPDENEIVEGTWISADESRDQFSVEQGMAEKLGLKLGDVISLRVADELIEAPVTSIRSVIWANFKPNFYLIANRQLIEQQPQTWLLSALIEGEQKRALKQLLTRFPSITLLDVSVFMTRVRAIVERASIALEFFFLFALASAFIVLLAAIQTGKHERQMESSLLRALAARSTQLYRVHVFEFTLMGLLIGFFAALFASLAGWLVSVQFFQIDYHFSFSTWVYSLVSATLVLTIAGILVSRKVYNETPMKILRS